MFNIKNNLIRNLLLFLTYDHLYNIRNQRCWESSNVRTTRFGTENIVIFRPRNMATSSKCNRKFRHGMVSHEVCATHTHTCFKFQLITVQCFFFFSDIRALTTLFLFTPISSCITFCSNRSVLTKSSFFFALSISAYVTSAPEKFLLNIASANFSLPS